MFHNKLDYVGKLFTQVEKDLYRTKLLYERNFFNYLNGIYLIRQGLIEEGMIISDRAIEILQEFEMYELADSLMKDRDHYIR